MRPNPTTDCSSHFNGDRILLLEYFFSCIEKGAQYGHVTRHKLNRKNKSCGTNIRSQLNRCQNTNSAKPNFLYSMEIAPHHPTPENLQKEPCDISMCYPQNRWQFPVSKKCFFQVMTATTHSSFITLLMPVVLSTSKYHHFDTTNILTVI